MLSISLSCAEVCEPTVAVARVEADKPGIAADIVLGQPGHHRERKSSAVSRSGYRPIIPYPMASTGYPQSGLLAKRERELSGDTDRRVDTERNSHVQQRDLPPTRSRAALPTTTRAMRPSCAAALPRTRQESALRMLQAIPSIQPSCPATSRISSASHRFRSESPARCTSRANTPAAISMFRWPRPRVRWSRATTAACACSANAVA